MYNEWHIFFSGGFLTPRTSPASSPSELSSVSSCQSSVWRTDCGKPPVPPRLRNVARSGSFTRRTEHPYRTVQVREMAFRAPSPERTAWSWRSSVAHAWCKRPDRMSKGSGEETARNMEQNGHASTCRAGETNWIHSQPDAAASARPRTHAFARRARRMSWIHTKR